MSVAGAAATVQYEALKRLVDTLERQKPNTVPCSVCGRPIAVEHIIIRDYKVICEQCYEKLYAKQQQTPKK